VGCGAHGNIRSADDGAIEIDEAEEEWRTADEKLAQFLADTLTERAI
jgi:hypothetical protein